MDAPSILLNNKITIPMIGLGTYNNWEDESKGNGWLLTALKHGYRHIDTARIYGTEMAVGQAIKKSGVPRRDLFVTSKLPWNHHHRVAQSFQESLKEIGLEYIDLYLMHWPYAVAYDEKTFLPRNLDGTLNTDSSITLNETWSEMEKLLQTGKVRAIGVSNFSIKTLEQLLKTARVTPAVNQVEMHPYLAQNELREYCLKKGISLAAYTPSGSSKVHSDPVILKLANKYKATPTQIILAWHISRDTIVLPKDVNVIGQKENIELPRLEGIDIAKISALDRGQRLTNKADVNGLVWGWTYEQLGW